MITSMQNARIKELVKLKQKKYREKESSYLVEGEHLVEEAIKAQVVELLVSTKPITSEYEVLLVTPEVMEKLSFTKHPQSILAKCQMLEAPALQAGVRYLILDTLQDPGNVGTLIRTALAFGIQQVILSPGCVDIYNDKVLRSMQGANFHIECLYQPLEDVIPWLQEHNVFVVGSALEGGKPIQEIASMPKMAYIVGNEGNGMRKSIMKQCDALAYIPITSIESLNVAIAGSIMMYHFTAESV